MKERCLVLNSGGQDSCTCLAIASDEYKEIYSLSFKYGQRNERELKSSKYLSGLAKAKAHFVVDLTFLSKVGRSALTSKKFSLFDKHCVDDSKPMWFVPGRNLLFLTVGAMKAYDLGIEDVYIGSCADDMCPDNTNTCLLMAEGTLRTCFDFNINLFAPLKGMKKKEIIEEILGRGKFDWMGFTRTCLSDSVYSCGECKSCICRAKGFEEAGVKDPLIEREEAVKEGITTIYW